MNNKTIRFSRHALLRMDQRGINKKTFFLFRDYGHLTYVRDALVLSLDKREKKFIQSDLDKKIYKKLEKQLDAYFVISHDDTVITAAHSYKKIRRH